MRRKYKVKHRKYNISGLRLNKHTKKYLNDDKIKTIISDAIMEYDCKKEQAINQQQQKDLKFFQNTVGYNKNENKIKDLFSQIYAIFRMGFIPQDKIKGDRISFGVIQMFTSLFFGLLQLGTFILGIILIFTPLCNYFKYDIYSIWDNFLYGLYGVLCLIFSSIFRIASIEINKIKDRNYIFNIFAAVSSIVSVLISSFAFMNGIK